MLFLPHRSSRFLVSALVLFPQGLRLKLVPVTFKILEPTEGMSANGPTVIEALLSKRLTQWPVSAPALRS